MSTKKYYEEINIARGIAILLVVIGHGLADIYQGVYAEGWCSIPARYFFVLIYSFHMPLFIFLSGFVNAGVCNLRESRLTFIRKKFCRLMIPYLVWGVIYVILDLIIGHYSIGEFDLGNYLTHLLIYGDNANWQLWTLYTLFLSSLLSMVLFDILHLSPKPVVIVSGMFSVAYLVGSTFLPLPAILYRTNVFSMLIYFVFFTGGILVRQMNLLDRKKTCSFLKILLLLLILVVNAAIGTYFAVRYDLAIDCTKLIGAALGIYILIKVSRQVSGVRMKKVWNCLGSYSMSIYLLANICQDFIRIPVRRQMLPQSLLIIGLIVSVAAGIVIPILLDKYILSRWKITRFLLLGQK